VSRTDGKTRAYSATSERAEQFCVELLKDFNGARAARDAGFSAARAKQAASELLALPEVQARVTALVLAQRERVTLDADTVLREFLRVGLCDIGGAFDDQGALKPIHEMSEEVRRAISSIETDELTDGVGKDKRVVGVVRKVKFWSKIDALMALAKHLKLLVDKLEVSADESLAALIVAARNP
jgi:phage terminase small subunit